MDIGHIKCDNFLGVRQFYHENMKLSILFLAQ